MPGDQDHIEYWEPSRRPKSQGSSPAGALLEAQEAAYRYVESVVHTADNPDEYGPMWHGWALKVAFVKGIEWEQSRASNAGAKGCEPCGPEGTTK